MMNIEEIKELILKDIGKKRRLGEHAGGSGHLAFRSIIKFELIEPKETLYEGKQAIEVICKYDIYTETEFLHPPERDEEYTEHYRDRYILDKNLNILTVEDLS
jgi:hypothetical protein